MFLNKEDECLKVVLKTGREDAPAGTVYAASLADGSRRCCIIVA